MRICLLKWSLAAQETKSARIAELCLAFVSFLSALLFFFITVPLCVCASLGIFMQLRLLVGDSRRNFKFQGLFCYVKMQKSHVKNTWYQTINTLKEGDLKPA